MSEIRTLEHPVLGDFFHARDLIAHLLADRDKSEEDGDKVTASILDRVIVNLATPLMLRDKVQPQAEEAPAGKHRAAPLHTEQEAPVANQ